jgi:chromosome segregation ATPase
MGDGSDIVNMPSISQLGPWVLVAVLMVPKILDWFEKLRGKQLDSDSSIKASEVAVKIAEINGRFDQQKSFQDVLVARCEKQMNEIESLLDRINTLNGNVMDRDSTIREHVTTIKDQVNTIAKMQREIDDLRRELDTVKAHVAAIEKDRDTIKAACHVEQPRE